VRWSAVGEEIGYDAGFGDDLFIEAVVVLDCRDETALSGVSGLDLTCLWRCPYWVDLKVPWLAWLVEIDKHLVVW